MQIIFSIFVFIIGAAFGSFLCCQARRLHLREEKNSKSSNQSHQKSLGKRSVCLHCGKQLKWYDNIPIISWLILRGKCRKCHKKIGNLEIFSEISTALALAAISTTVNVNTATPLDWYTFILVTIFTLALIFLAIYDGMCGELPNFALIVAVILAITSITPTLINNFSIQPFLSAGLYGGIYLLLYLISKGKWVGDGDWILAATTGLVLGSPWISMVALFLANFAACIVTIPTLKKRQNHQIYFGPFLVFAFIVAYTFSDFFISMI